MSSSAAMQFVCEESHLAGWVRPRGCPDLITELCDLRALRSVSSLHTHYQFGRGL